MVSEQEVLLRLLALGGLPVLSDKYIMSIVPGQVSNFAISTPLQVIMFILK